MIARGLAVALAVAIAAGGLQTWRLAAEQADHASTMAKHAEHIADLARTAAAAETAARTEERRRTEALQGVIDETHQKLALAYADADAAADTGERLRAQLATITRRCRIAPSDPAPAGAGQAAGATLDLLADVQRRLDEASNGIARYADEAHASGHACERAYAALTPAQ